MSKKYKAIVSDIDGTITPIVLNAMPSEKVTQAIKKVTQKGIIFSMASGRPFYLVDYLIKHFNLNSPVITDNGAVINNAQGIPIWEELLSYKEATEILKLTKNFKLTRISTEKDNPDNPKIIPKNVKVRKVSVHGITTQEADIFIKEIETKFKDLSVIKAAAYEGEHLTDVYISNAHATKQHAIFKYAQILGIKTEEIIGIGDGYNDFPLLMACGLKVAMGNAVPDLKAIADYVAPSVYDDGLAHVLDKYF